MRRTRYFESRGLYRSDDAVLFGVCGGLAEYFDFSPWGVRLAFILLSLPFFWTTVPVYIVLAIMMKRRPSYLSDY